MQDPVLNASLEETHELQTRWNQFHDFVKMAMDGQKVTPQAEMKFLELKSRIAMLHDGFMARLEHEQKTGQNIMNIVGDIILLGRMNDATDAEHQKFEFDWNDCFLLINEQVGTLEEEQNRLANISERAYNASKRKERMVAAVGNAMQSIYFKLSVGAFVVFMIVWGIPTFGIYDYKELYKYTWARPAYVAFVNYVYRPYLSKNFEYVALNDVLRNTEDVDLASIKKESNAGLTKDYFKNQAVWELGFAQQDKQKLDELLGRLRGFEAERYNAQGNDCRFFWLIFDNSGDALAFLDMANTSASQLPANNKVYINQNTHVMRRANFIAIGIGTHGHKSGHITQRWKLEGASLIYAN